MGAISFESYDNDTASLTFSLLKVQKYKFFLDS